MALDPVRDAQSRLEAAQQEHFATNREMQENMSQEQREHKAIEAEFERKLAPLKSKRDDIQRSQGKIHEKIKELSKLLSDTNAELVALQNFQTKIISEIQGSERDLGKALVRLRAVYSNKNELLKLKERRLRGNLVTLEQDVRRRQDEQTAMLKRSIDNTSKNYAGRPNMPINSPANSNKRPSSWAA